MVKIGGEFVFGNDRGAPADGYTNPRPTYSWILFGSVTSTGRILLNEDTVSLALRISGIHDQGGGYRFRAGDEWIGEKADVYKVSLAPAYNLNKHLTFRLEGSGFTGKVKDKATSTKYDYNGWFVGAQVLLKF